MRHRSTLRLGAALLALGALLAARPAALHAQHVSFGPDIGIYIPTSELLKAAQGEEFKHDVSILLGARMDVAFTPRVGFEAVGDYSPSKLRFDITNGSRSTIDANVFSGSGRLYVWLLPPRTPVNVRLAGGVGVVHRSGDAFVGRTDLTNVAPSFGAALRVRLPGVGHIQLNADTYFYKQAFDDPLGTANSTQKDIHLSLGFGFGA
jgi:hypothetical protein